MTNKKPRNPLLSKKTIPSSTSCAEASRLNEFYPNVCIQTDKITIIKK